jgi:hypothetical protein
MGVKLPVPETSCPRNFLRGAVHFVPETFRNFPLIPLPDAGESSRQPMLAPRAIDRSLSNICMCSMEVLDEHQITANLVGLAVEEQALIR